MSLLGYLIAQRLDRDSLVVVASSFLVMLLVLLFALVPVAKLPTARTVR